MNGMSAQPTVLRREPSPFKFAVVAFYAERVDFLDSPGMVCRNMCLFALNMFELITLIWCLKMYHCISMVS